MTSERINPSSFGLRSRDLYSSVIPEIPRRVIMTADSLEGMGKTTFGLTAPGPILFIAGDKNYNGPLQEAAAKKKIIPCFLPFDFPEKATEKQVSDAAQPVWRRFREAYSDGLRSRGIRSIVIDTGSFLWEVRRASAFGKLEQVPPTRYAKVNFDFINRIHEAKRYDKHVIWLHRLKDEWVTKKDKNGKERSVQTGRLKREGFKDLGYEVPIAVRIDREPDGFGLPTGEIILTVVKCTLRRGVVGEELRDKKANFARLASLCYGTDVSEWR